MGCISEPYIIHKTATEEIAVDNPEYQKKIQNEKYLLYLKQSGIPEFYHTIEFKDYHGNKESDEFKKIFYYANHCHEEKFDHVSLYLYGSNGVQKTAISSNIGKQAIRNGLRVKFVLAGDLINKLIKLQGYVDYNNEIIQNIYRQVQELKQCDLLILDDVGDPEKTLQWKNSPLLTVEWDNFFRELLASKTKIVMTSNFDIETFKQYFSQSIFELLDRNTVKIHLTESIKNIRKLNVEKVFEGI